MKNKNLILITILSSALILTSLSLNLNNVTAETYLEPTPAPPNQNIYWDFNNDTKIAWDIYFSSMGYEYSSTQYYNISSMKFLYNESWDGYFHTVQLSPIYYDTNVMDWKTNFSIGAYNCSWLNFTDVWYPYYGELIPSDMREDDLGLFFNPFIPINGTEGIMLDWALKRLYYDYHYYVSFSHTNSTSFATDHNVIEYSNAGTGEYVRMVYYDNGTLKTGELKSYILGTYTIPQIINFTRTFDFDPFDDIEISVEIGDKLYYGDMLNETLLEIDEFTQNTTYMGSGDIYYVQVWANRSVWNYTAEQWELIDKVMIGQISEDLPLVMGGDDSGPFLPIIVANGTTGKDLYDIFSTFIAFISEYDTLNYGSNWLQLYNSSTKDSMKFMYNASGILLCIDGIGESPFNQNNYDEWVLFYKNSTLIDAPARFTLDLNMFFVDGISITMNVSASNWATYMYNGFHPNPTEVPLADALAYFDIWINDTSVISDINITITYDLERYENLEIWYFNMTSEEWIKTTYTSLAEGKIFFETNITTIWAITGVDLQEVGDDDDDNGDDDDDGISEIQIPLGNYYLLFLAIGIICLVYYKKSKI